MPPAQYTAPRPWPSPSPPQQQQHSRAPTTTTTGGVGPRETPPSPASHEPSCAAVPAEVARHHEHAARLAGQCCSVTVQAIAAPVEVVWSLVRQFDSPQAYKHWIWSCRLVGGDADANGGSTVAVGSVRELELKTGIPATSSRERLEILDDERRVFSFRVVGGDHALVNYRSVTTVHEGAGADAGGTVVVESYVVDVPQGNTAFEARRFVGFFVRSNLKSLASKAEHLALALA